MLTDYEGKMGFEKVLWCCLRAEPVIYANDRSYASRDENNPHVNLPLGGFSIDEVLKFQDILVEGIQKGTREQEMQFRYQEETYAELPEDRESIFHLEAVTNVDHDIRSVNTAFQQLR